MIFVTNTPNNAGVVIHGDFMDFDSLREALYAIVGEEDEFTQFTSSRTRILGVCYDLRHANMGDREIEFIDNGMDEYKMKNLATISPDKNAYFVINTLWPETLFVMMALNDFVRLYVKKRVKLSYHDMLDFHIIWDDNIAQARMFQAAITKCLRQILSQASFARVTHLLNKDYTWLEGYAEQYVDLLNIRFLDMDKEKRLKSLPTIAKRLSEEEAEYRKIKDEVYHEAKENNCAIDDIRLSMEYPEEVDW
jgi:hypothetical protein